MAASLEAAEIVGSVGALELQKGSLRAAEMVGSLVALGGAAAGESVGSVDVLGVATVGEAPQPGLESVAALTCSVKALLATSLRASSRASTRFSSGGTPSSRRAWLRRCIRTSHRRRR